MEKLKNISISDDPISGLKRLVDVTYFLANFEDEVIDVTCTVKYFNQDDSAVISKRFLPYEVRLRVDKHNLVDISTGMYKSEYEYTNGGSSDGATFIQEYDFYIIVSDNSINIFDLLVQNVNVADTRRRFNI